MTGDQAGHDDREQVRQAAQDTAGATPLERLPPTHPTVQGAAQDEADLRKAYGWAWLALVAVQLLIADIGFFAYAIFGVHWHIDAEVMNVWLSATVVQAIAIATVVTRSLFRDRR